MVCFLFCISGGLFLHKRVWVWERELFGRKYFRETPIIILPPPLLLAFNKKFPLSLQRKETLPVSKIQSVKALRKGIRDIPRAFEIFTDDQRYVFKAKGQQNVEQWVQCLHIAVVRSHHNPDDSLWNVPQRSPLTPSSDTRLSLRALPFDTKLWIQTLEIWIPGSSSDITPLPLFW